MRFPPNLKFFLFFVLAVGLIILGTLYLPKLIPGIGKIMIGIVLVGMALLSFFALFKPMFTFLYARADGILEVFIDKGNKGFHVFAYHINPGGESSGSNTRDIQQYYLLSETGKVFYKCIYAHRMKPASGRSGWEGYISFEESVLTSPMFDRSMAKLSGKTGTPLQLGEKIKATADNHYNFEMNGKRIELRKFESAMDEGIKVVCSDTITKQPVWQKKI